MKKIVTSLVLLSYILCAAGADNVLDCSSSFYGLAVDGTALSNSVGNAGFISAAAPLQLSFRSHHFHHRQLQLTITDLSLPASHPIYIGAWQPSNGTSLAWPIEARAHIKAHRVYQVEITALDAGNRSCSLQGVFRTPLTTWQAQWISYSNAVPKNECDTLYGNVSTPRLRSVFTVPARQGASLQSATLQITGLGWYVAEVNGKRVGASQLDPAWTSYNRTILYSAYDVLQLLNSPGQASAIGITLGRGWWNPVQIHLFGRFDLYRTMTTGPERALVQLDVVYSDNSSWQYVSESQSGQWTCSRSGPIRGNSVYFGEVRLGGSAQGILSEDQSWDDLALLAPHHF